MTAAYEPNSNIMSKLIRSCRTSREGFQTAAETVEDANLKRLFDLYALQRTRFAEELRQYLPMHDDGGLEGSTGRSGPKPGSPADLLRFCLDADENTLAVYRQALADRAISTKAHFLISAQFSLLQRVRDRMHLLLNHSMGASSARHTERAAL